MSGILRLSNNATGQSTLNTNATRDVTYSLPDTSPDDAAIILTNDAHEVTSINWDGIDVTIQNGDINLDNGTLFVDHSESRVGIGTTSPQAKLDIFTVTGPYFRGGSDNTARQLIIESSTTTNPGDTHTLRASSTSGEIAFANSINTELVRIDRSGRVGIGTDSPYSITGANTLSIQNPSGSSEINFLSSTTGFAALYFGDATSGTDSYAGYLEYKHSDNYMRFATGSNERMRIQSTGNVNIGRQGDHNDSTARLSVFNSGASASWSVRPGTNVADQVDIITYDYGTASYLPTRNIGDSWIWFDGDNGERMRIDNTGKLLLGTSNSSNKAGGFANALQVEGLTAAQASISIIRNSNDQNPTYLNFGKSRGTDRGSNALVSNGDILTIIDFSGSNGSNATFRSFASIRATVNGETSSTSCPGRIAFWTTPAGSINPSERMSIDNLGKVVVRTSQAANTRNRVIQLECSGQGRGAILSGDSDTDPATFGSGSDRRLKTNIREYTGGLERIKQIPVKIYDEANTNATDVIGWIADEISPIFPDAVIGEPNAVDAEGNPEYQMLASLKFYPDLIQCVQTLVAKIEALEAEVSNLKANS